MAQVQQTTVDGVQADIAGAIEVLRERGATRFATVGFCFGGTHSFLAATNRDLPIDRVVGFYGGLGERPNRPSPIATASRTRCPVRARSRPGPGRRRDGQL